MVEHTASVHKWFMTATSEEQVQTRCRSPYIQEAHRTWSNAARATKAICEDLVPDISLPPLSGFRVAGTKDQKNITLNVVDLPFRRLQNNTGTGQNGTRQHYGADIKCSLQYSHL